MNNKMPNGTVSVTANIIASIRVHITALRPDFQRQQPVYALNWFNASWLWLYNFYNFLAIRSVLNVDGIPFFKARVGRILHGDIEGHRTVLLIVRYPNIDRFKTMMESRYFQLVSIIRSIAVKEFTFAFSTRLDTQETDNSLPITKIDDGGAYVIHHFRNGDNNDDFTDQIRELANASEVDLVFSSKVSARLYAQQGEKAPSAVDAIMDGCLILQAQTDTDIERLIASDEYQALIRTTQSSFVATLNRIF